jgi:GMP synthase (glutamine-hydrolysing) A subunit
VHVLGICYGMQLLVQKLGGEVTVGDAQEYGKMEIEVGKESALYAADEVGGHQTVWMSHGDEAVRLPDGFEVVARSTQGAVAGIEDRKRRFYGLQYHPEVSNYCLEEWVSLKINTMQLIVFALNIHYSLEFTTTFVLAMSKSCTQH